MANSPRLVAKYFPKRRELKVTGVLSIAKYFPKRRELKEWMPSAIVAKYFPKRRELKV